MVALQLPTAQSRRRHREQISDPGVANKQSLISGQHNSMSQTQLSEKRERGPPADALTDYRRLLACSVLRGFAAN